MIQLHQNQNTNLSPFLVYSMTVPTIDYIIPSIRSTQNYSMTFLPSSRSAMYNVYELESIHISPHSTVFPTAPAARTFFSPLKQDHAPKNIDCQESYPHFQRGFDFEFFFQIEPSKFPSKFPMKLRI